MAVLSKEVYSPQHYIEAVTGNYYIFRNDTTRLDEIQALLRMNGFKNLLNYPLTEIDHIVENKINVVLVDVSDFKDNNWVAEYRWFEIPKDFCCNDN